MACLFNKYGKIVVVVFFLFPIELQNYVVISIKWFIIILCLCYFSIELHIVVDFCLILELNLFIAIMEKLYFVCDHERG